MERLDKIIASQTSYSRNEVKKLISSGKVLVNEKIVEKSDLKFDPNYDKITINGEKLDFKSNIYLMLNKPKGYVSSTNNHDGKNVLDLIPEKFMRKGLFPAGRLDKDTTGLMIITDDGVFAHNILSPRKHVRKIYEVTLDVNITDDMIKKFYDGIYFDGKMSKPAILEKLDSNKCKVTIREGRYHQIKRMFEKCNAKVIELNRICIGNLYLPNDLELGKCREVTSKELKLITN